MQQAEVRTLVGVALEAIRRGEIPSGIALFERVVNAGMADASLFIALAAAHRRANSFALAIQSIDNALRLAPYDIRANILKADLLEESGDSRGASAFYLAALKSSTKHETLPDDVRAELVRAQTRCNAQTDTLETFVRERLKESLRRDDPAFSRFGESVDILFQRKQVYLQQPRYFFYPGLPHIQFFNSKDFSWLGQLESATETIRRELLSVLETPSAFRPYVEGAADRPHNAQQGMLNNPDWSAFYLWKNGEIVAENAARCPETIRALAFIPLARVPNRSPSVLFSLLKPGAHIPPHNGLINTRMIGHLPLIVPDGCEFRVGNETRSWREGEAWLFDDTIEHEAWNRSDQTRVILLFEVWREELTADERSGVCALLAAIDSYAGRKPEWEI
ncbi:MAG: aspartyl/asparaginyl beta-hydroxylase domain-containing protein [Rhodocyclaceae bacterium]|nr:aspartyl/asparaginyl beta-hydroxylase domain-containing protein [Rhodocyclaceae bacterium]MCA3052231.1 aspartyl/asparaginyl beta-hydroxylase domain-containing protein [Rhodocyclaceae bacterium]